MTEQWTDERTDAETRSLRGWLDRGGNYPPPMYADEFDAWLAAVIARAKREERKRIRGYLDALGYGAAANRIEATND